MLDCPHCHLGNMPFDRTCRHCAGEMQSAEQAQAKKVEWDALPAEVRTEYEKNFNTLDQLHRDHLNWWKTHRRLTMAMFGAVTAGGMLFIAPSWIGFPIDFALGALAMRWLFNHKGGAFKGLGISFVLFLVCTTVNAGASMVERSGGSMGGAIVSVTFTVFGAALMFVGGYFIGDRIADEHSARSTVA